MDDKLLKYFYEELIMSLITMSLPAEKQKEMIGIGCIGDEMLEDFHSFYSLKRELYIENNIFNERQLKILDEFNGFLDKYCGHSENFYWDIEELKNNTLWSDLRKKSKEVLSSVFKNKYKIELHREYRLINGKTLQDTKRRLIEIDD